MQSQLSRQVSQGARLRLVRQRLRYDTSRQSLVQQRCLSVGTSNGHIHGLSRQPLPFSTLQQSPLPSGSSRHNYHTTPWYRQRHTHTVLSPSSSLNAVSTVNSDSNQDDFMDEHVDRFAAQCISQMLPRYNLAAAASAGREMSSLDLELGEAAWDNPWDESAEEEDVIVEEDTDGHATETNAPGPAQQQRDKHQSAMDLLLEFDPQNPPSMDNPQALQLWLECEAQQEAVSRYQKIIDSARDRKDYSSLSMVQRQVLRWFQPLRDEIESRQKDYVWKQGTAMANAKAAKRYGPYLCALPPEKLAVIVAHEAIMFLLLKSGADGREGVPFVAMARRLGEAVEEEVLIHRLMHKRFKDGKLRMDEADLDLSGDDDDETPSDSIQGLANETAPGNTANVDAMPDNPDSAEATRKWAYASSHLKKYMEELSQHEPSSKKRRVVSYAIRRARQILEKADWTESEKIQLGAALFQVLLEKATLSQDGKEEMAFTYEKRWFTKNKTRSYVELNEGLHKMVVSDKLQSFGSTTTKHKPMILPPTPWTEPNEGGYNWLKVDLMRYHGCNTQKDAMQNADLSTVFDGLNALGRVPWQINKRILDVANHCWDNSIALGDIPSQTDFDVPQEPIRPERSATKFEKDTPAYDESVAEYRLYREALTKYRRIKQKNMDLRSLRCSAMLKLDQATKFGPFENIYFPYNMDFRGRAYPVPPHLSNVGSDLCRGMLKFAEEKPLGSRGLYWLKVHLANFAGKDKMSFDERAKFVDDHIEQIRASAADPFAGERWWMTLEDPFQGLATCIEIINAIDSGDPESFMCSLPVHMDGSCNGLQHYAALGRDRVGGKAVNLCNTEEPQDVYVGVMHEVIRRVAEEAERQVDFDTSDLESLSRTQKKEYKNNRAAKLVNGLIDRGVVKRTVMTSVYGVTYIGARQQIQEKIESKLESKGIDIDENRSDIFNACGYLARVTMDVMGDLFTGAKDTMNWLTTCARMISQHGYPVAWISPIGIPAIQPYRQKRSATLVTLMQTVTLVEESDDLPIHKQRQVSAFPPNYIHSLDSSHMLLTALEMDRRGLSFSAVHDSFWTHACNIDEMNGALRDVFVELYDQPLLEDLLATWQLRYPDLDFPKPPKQGELDLFEVKKAPYFFQ